MNYKGLIISDIHIGSIKAKKLKEELYKGFIKYLQEKDNINYIVITGDLFDTKLSMNSEHAKLVFSFIRDLINICTERNIKLRIIKGTEYHDNNQLDLLLSIKHDECNMRIINTVTEEELFTGYNVLYIPEEYLTDKDEYYKEYFTKPNGYYNMIFGHGMINEVAFIASVQESALTMSRAPIFKSEDLLRISSGLCFFGHIHTHQVIKDRIVYVGSYSRYSFGETEPKGFILTDGIEFELIENKEADTYNTHILNVYNDFDKTNIDDINKMIEDSSCDNLRLIFNIDESHENSKYISDILKDVFGKLKNVKIIIKNNVINGLKKKESDERIKNLMIKYDFIFDKGMSMEEKLVKFIKLKYDVVISIDHIYEYLNRR
jgi:DNA repair exonuclease SbcCD nuclease subunit